MRRRLFAGVVASGAAVVVAGLAAPWPAGAAAANIDPQVLAVAKATLPAKDGWASIDGGTTGGSSADSAHISVVHNRTELVDALGGDNATNITNDKPKIIVVDGTIDGNAKDTDGTYTCDDYAAGTGYTLEKYLTEANARKVKPDPKDSAQPQEAARTAAAAKQAAQTNIFVGSNTTILGLKGAKFVHANLRIGSFVSTATSTTNVNVSNVIVRNITFEDAADCFPQWDPTDGTNGNWNSDYDTVSIIDGTNIWIDHNDFSDGSNPDSKQLPYIGRPYQVHDGLLDITRSADKITVSYNYLHDHDKTMLIGGSDKPTGYTDAGALRVTLHHNLFKNLGQRVPRVRFGQLDVYDNHYVTGPKDGPYAKDGYNYSWGVGVGSRIYTEKNFFTRDPKIGLDKFVYNWRKDGYPEPAITEKDTLVASGSGQPTSVSLVDEYNKKNPTKVLKPVTDWTPDLRPGPLTAVADVPTVVDNAAGVGKLWTERAPSPAASPSASASPAAAPGLPVTGTNGPLVAGIGTAMLAFGGVVYLIARRRRQIVFISGDDGGRS